VATFMRVRCISPPFTLDAYRWFENEVASSGIPISRLPRSVLKDASFFIIIREVTMSGLLVGYWSILHNLGTCRIDSSPNQPH
jgi:hypothetical protein